VTKVDYIKLESFADSLRREGVREIPRSELRRRIAQYFNLAMAQHIDMVLRSLGDLGFIKPSGKHTQSFELVEAQG